MFKHVHVLIFRWFIHFCKSTETPSVLDTIDRKKNHYEYLHELTKFKDPKWQWSDPADKLIPPVL